MSGKIDYGTRVTTIDGEDGDLSQHKGRVLLVVNTASKCGFTPQFAGLEKLHQEFNGQGLDVLGFPCNQFGKQDPGADSEIASFCQRNYGVSFDMHSKVSVNGPETHPLFRQLKSAQKGILGSEAIKWNFTKFLVNREGTVVKRYGPRTSPKEIISDIKGALGAS